MGTVFKNATSEDKPFFGLNVTYGWGQQCQAAKTEFYVNDYLAFVLLALAFYN